MIIHGTTILHMRPSTANDIFDIRTGYKSEDGPDRAVLIMGSADDITAGLAETLLDMGWHVAAAYDDTAALFKLVEQLADNPSHGRRCGTRAV